MEHINSNLDRKIKNKKPYNWKGKGWNIDMYMFEGMRRNEKKELFLYCIERMTLTEFVKSLLGKRLNIEEAVLSWGYKWAVRLSAMNEMAGSSLLPLKKEYKNGETYYREYELSDDLTGE